MRQRLAALFVFLLASNFTVAQASVILDGVSDSSYTSLASSYSSMVGSIYETTSSGTYIGSGSVISSTGSGVWVLTAAHVVDDATALSFNINGSSYSASSWYYHSSVSDSNVASSSVGDLGLVYISTSIANVTAATIYTGATSNLLGKTATFVGYGNTGTGSTGAKSGSYGTLRAVQNVLDTTASAQWGSSYSASVLLSDFDSASSSTGTSSSKTSSKVSSTSGKIGGGFNGKNNGPGGFGNNNKGGGNPGKNTGGGNNNNNNGNNSSSNNNTISSGNATPLALEGLIAGGDSGGGDFVTIDGVNYLVGVNSFVSASDGKVDSDYGDISGVVSVSDYVDWIEQITGISLSSTSSSSKTSSASVAKGGLLTSATSAEAVPEPSTLCVLMMTGMALVLWRRRR